MNKASLIEKIAELVKEKKIEGISDLRDESDRDGMRIVIELKKDENPQIILNHLYKQTQMQSSFGIIMLAIVNGRPKVLTLAADDRPLHRPPPRDRHPPHHFRPEEGGSPRPYPGRLKIALDWLDAVIELIRASKNPAEAKEGLMAGTSPIAAWLKKLGLALPANHALYAKPVRLSEIQAQAILEMRLQRLTGLEREKILQEYKDILKLIARLKEILGSETEILKIIVGRTTGTEREVRRRAAHRDRRQDRRDHPRGHHCRRRHGGHHHPTPAISSGVPSRSTAPSAGAARARSGMKTKEEDFVEHLFIASSKDYMMFFTDAGAVYWLKVYEIPEGGRATRGKAIVNLLNLNAGEKISAILSVKEFSDDRYLMMATRQGVVKKSPLKEYSNIRVGGIIAVNLDEGDKLISRGPHRRQAGCPPGFEKRQVDPFPGGGCPPHRPRRSRGTRHDPGGR